MRVELPERGLGAVPAGDGGHPRAGVDDLGRLTELALSALEDGLTRTMRHAGLDWHKV